MGMWADVVNLETLKFGFVFCLICFRILCLTLVGNEYDITRTRFLGATASHPTILYLESAKESTRNPLGIPNES